MARKAVVGPQTFLRSVSLARKGGDSFPFSVPAVRTLPTLTFDTPVTFLVGENGSGKSTVLEGLALACKLPTVGSSEGVHDESLSAQRQLANALKLVWHRKTTRGFFLRAEDFFGFTKRLSQMRAEMQREIAAIDATWTDRSDYAKRLAKGPLGASLAEMERRYGADLDANSHGQSFLKLFGARLVPDGLYLLDEPEAPLSPQSQLGLIAMMADAVAEGGQFIIATHSPLLLSYPGAAIYSFDSLPAKKVEFSELDHVTLTREFLNNPERFLRELLREETTEPSSQPRRARRTSGS
jgi:predicted ATPase